MGVQVFAWCYKTIMIDSMSHVVAGPQYSSCCYADSDSKGHPDHPDQPGQVTSASQV